MWLFSKLMSQSWNHTIVQNVPACSRNKISHQLNWSLFQHDSVSLRVLSPEPWPQTYTPTHQRLSPDSHTNTFVAQWAWSVMVRRPNSFGYVHHWVLCQFIVIHLTCRLCRKYCHVFILIGQKGLIKWLQQQLCQVCGLCFSVMFLYRY